MESQSRNVSEGTKRACLHCGGPLPPSKRRPRKFCSLNCKSAHYYRLKHPPKLRQPDPPGVCAYCTGPTKPANEFCSVRCANLNQGLRAVRVCTRCRAPWTPGWSSKAGGGRKAKGETECWMCRSEGHVQGGRDRSCITRSRRKMVLHREDFCCQDCHTRFPEDELDCHHVVPGAMGGTHELKNLRLLCHDCHRGSGWARNHAPLVLAGLVVPPVDTQLALVA